MLSILPEVAALTGVGRLRSVNEDAFGISILDAAVFDGDASAASARRLSRAR